MRLWHEELLPFLSWDRLYAQHMTCCSIRRGNRRSNRGPLIEYLPRSHPGCMYCYHASVIHFLKQHRPEYRTRVWEDVSGKYIPFSDQGRSKYREHNNLYLVENLLNLEMKGYYYWTPFQDKLGAFLEQDWVKEKVDLYIKSYKDKTARREAQKEFLTWYQDLWKIPNSDDLRFIG